MGKQFNPKFAACTSLFFFLAFTGTILAQNPSKGAAAARDATRNRGRATTTQRQAPPTALASLDRRSSLTLTPIVIYYSRDGAEVAARTSPNVEKRTAGIGESITIYYGSKKSSTEPTRPVAKPKDERLASNVATTTPKPSPQKSYSSSAATSFAPATEAPRREALEAPTGTTGPISSPPPATTEKPADAVPADSKTSVTEPAAVVEAPSAKTDENSNAAGAEPIVATESETKPPPPPASNSSNDTKLAAEGAPPPPVPNPSTDAKSSTETVPAIPNPVDTKPATETAGPPPVSNPSTETKLATETAAAIPNSTGDTKPATETAVATAPISAADTVAMNNKAVQLTRERRYEEASVLLRQAIQVEPDTFKFHRNLSIVYEEMNKMNEALESAKTAVKLAPREPSVLTQLCGVQLRLKEHNEALSCYENLKKLTTLDPLAQTYYGVALLGSGRVLDALAVLEKAAAATPASSVTLNALGFVYFNERRFPDAVSTFKKAVELAPDQHEMRLNLAIAHLANGNREGAISQYRVLKQENPKLAEQLYQILFRDKVVSIDQLKPR